MITRQFLESLARTLLPLMDDPRSFTNLLPPCTADAHDWGIAYDKTVKMQMFDATTTCTYPVAVECLHCNFIVGLW